MKRIILAAVMVLSLAGASVFAQNSNKKPAAKPKNATATAASSNTGGTMHKGKKRHHKKSNSNSGGTMTPKAKKGNSNKP